MPLYGRWNEPRFDEREVDETPQERLAKILRETEDTPGFSEPWTGYAEPPGGPPLPGYTWDGDEGVWRSPDGSQWISPDGSKSKTKSPMDTPEPPSGSEVLDKDRWTPDSGGTREEFTPRDPMDVYDVKTPLGQPGSFDPAPNVDYLNLPPGFDPSEPSRPPWDMPSRPSYHPMPQPTPIGPQTPPPGPGQAVGGRRPFAPHGDILGYYSQALRYGGLPRSTGPGGQPGGYY